MLALIGIKALSLHPAIALADTARTDAPSSLGVTLPSCPPSLYDPRELREALTLELQQRHLDPSTLPRIELTGCGAPVGAIREAQAVARLELRVFDAEAALVSKRTIRLDDTPFEARSRLLALWIAESLAASSDASASTPADAPAAAAEGPTAPEDGGDLDHLDHSGKAPADGDLTSSSSAQSSAPSLELGAALQARFPLSKLAGFWGVEANLGGPIAGYLRWAVEGAMAVHTSSTPLGELHVTWKSAAAGVDFADRGSVPLCIGPRVSLAHVSAIGENSLGFSSIEQNANLVSLGARASIGTTIGGAWQLAASLGAERALRGLVLTAGRERTVALDGWLGEATVGLRYAF
jgi:hypothetical protein